MQATEEFSHPACERWAHGTAISPSWLWLAIRWGNHTTIVERRQGEPPRGEAAGPVRPLASSPTATMDLLSMLSHEHIEGAVRASNADLE